MDGLFRQRLIVVKKRAKCAPLDTLSSAVMPMGRKRFIRAWPFSTTAFFSTVPMPKNRLVEPKL